eukprot:1162125-Pelagomonas_calceolata.AAC.6
MCAPAKAWRREAGSTAPKIVSSMGQGVCRVLCKNVCTNWGLSGAVHTAARDFLQTSPPNCAYRSYPGRGGHSCCLVKNQVLLLLGYTGYENKVWRVCSRVPSRFAPLMGGGLDITGLLQQLRVHMGQILVHVHRHQLLSSGRSRPHHEPVPPASLTMSQCHCP